MKKLFYICCCFLLLIITGCDSNITENSNSKDLLSSKVKVGDYVDYKTVANSSYVSTSDKTGYSKDQSFTTTGEEKWRVFSVSNDGSVTLISAEPIRTSDNNTYYLTGKNGYDNSVSELNNIAKIYGNGSNAKTSKSLTREDLNELIGIDKFTEFYSINVDDYDSVDDKWNVVFSKVNENYGKSFTTNSATETVTSYEINLSDLVEENTTYQSLLNGRYWLANQIVDYYYENHFLQGEIKYFSYGVGYVSSASSSSNKFTLDSAYSTVALLASDNYSVGDDLTKFNRYVRPLVILEEDTITTGGDGSVDLPFELVTDNK